MINHMVRMFPIKLSLCIISNKWGKGRERVWNANAHSDWVTANLAALCKLRTQTHTHPPLCARLLIYSFFCSENVQSYFANIYLGILKHLVFPIMSITGDDYQLILRIRIRTWPCRHTHILNKGGGDWVADNVTHSIQLCTLACI